MRPLLTTLYITRHGETLWNLEGRLQGHLDSALSPTGRAQVRALAARLRELEPTVLYTSDLGRTVETAHAIAASCALTPLVDARLRERHLGVFQGLTPQEIRLQHLDAWREFQRRDPDFVIPGGESARQRARRSIAALRDIALCHAGERIVIVGHGGTLDSIYRACADVDLRERRAFSMANASLNTVDFHEGSWRFVRWGDTEHLATLRSER